MSVIKREQDFNSTLDYIPENEYFNFEQEYRFYMETKRIEYIRNYLSNEAVGLEELIEIERLLQCQELERIMRVHKEIRSLDRYRQQPKKTNITILMTEGYCMSLRI